MSDALTPALMAEIHAEAFDTPWDEAAFAGLLDSPGVCALGDEAGFILVRTIVDEAEILTVAVRPSARRQGKGRTLVEQAIVKSKAMGGERLFLEVAETNLPAQGLYGVCGFEIVGRRAKYYRKPDGSFEDALMMALNFPL